MQREEWEEEEWRRETERHRRKRGKVRGGEEREKKRDDGEDDADLLPLDQPVLPASEMMLSRSLCST